MTNASEVAEHSAQICIAVLAFGSGAAGALSVVPVSLAALFAIGASSRLDRRRNCYQAAIKDTLESLKQSAEFSESDLSRASILLQKPGPNIELDPNALEKGIEGGAANFDARLASRLMTSIDFEPGDEAPRSAILCALSTAVATCRRHPDVHRDLTQNLLIEVSRDQGVQITALNQLDSKMDDLLQLVEGMSRERPQNADTLLDFVHRTNNDPLLAELAYKMTDSGVQLAFFHNKQFKVEIKVVQYFEDEHRLVFVTSEGKLREMGVPTNAEFIDKLLRAEFREKLRRAYQVLFVLLDPDSGKAKEGHYVPFKVYA